MAKHDIDSWILDETELAEHYKDIGKPEGYDSKMELVGLLKQLKEYQHLEEQDRIIKFYHLIIDPLKARWNKITYMQDQVLHYIIGLTYLL